MKPTACPSADELTAFVLGKLPEDVLNRVADHSSRCGKCQKVLQNLDGAADPMVQIIRKGRAPAGPAPALAPLLKKAEAISVSSPGVTVSTDDTQGGLPQVTQDLRAVLAPAQGPGEMGRLGRYRVLKLLGHGGMGMVFQAEDPGLQRTVALKVMLPSVAANAAAKERFLREARATAAIEHDHIVTIYQVDEDRGVAFLAMQFLKGMSLEDYLKKAKETNKPLTLGQILKLGREIGKGLAAAHERGLIHRDIKPANIWLDATSGGRAKILDFGLARPAATDSNITQSGMIVGTPAYMAPEQATGLKIDGRADLFSLGVVLYRLCSGRLPWKGDTAMATLMAVATEDCTPLAELCPKLPPALIRLVMQLLAKKPDERPNSAKAVVEAIIAIEKEAAGVKVAVPVQAPPNQWQMEDASETAPLVKAPERKRTRRWPLVAVGLLVAACGIAAWQVIIRIENKDGSKTEIKVPNGATVTVEKDGKQLAQVGGAGQGGDPVAARPGEIDLLKLIDPEKNAIKGKWRFENQQLVTPRELFDRLQIPVTPPLDYELEVVATRTEGKDALNLGLVHGKHQFVLTLDGYFGKVTGLAYLDGLDVHRHDFWYRQKIFTDGQPCHILCRVQQQGIQVTCDGKEVVKWQDYSRLTISPKWELPNKTQLAVGVGADTVYKIQKMVLRPLDPVQPSGTGVDEAWIKMVQALPPAQQVPAVAAKLKELNPGFDGKVTQSPPTKEHGLEIRFCTDNVTDISPVRGLAPRLAGLFVSGSAPGKGRLGDLSPVRRLPELLTLEARCNPIADLRVLEGLPIRHLYLTDVEVNDLAPLEHMLSLQTLHFTSRKKVDLEHLRHTTVRYLLLPEDWLTPDRLSLVKSLWLTRIQEQAPIDFWKKHEPQYAVFWQWIQDTRKLQAEQQVAAVTAKLKELNPGFDGKVTPFIDERGRVTRFKFYSKNALDISPIRALTDLKHLDCPGTMEDRSNFYDLSPVRGMNLEQLTMTYTRVKDLSPLRGMTTLKRLYCNDTLIDDLSPLTGISLQQFYFFGTGVKDFSVLQQMPLTAVWIDDRNPAHRAAVANIPTLETVNWKPKAAVLGIPVDPGFEQWIKDTQKLPPAKQVKAVAAKLKELNPGFDGKVEHKLTADGQAVREIQFSTDAVSNISPVRALPKLNVLHCDGSRAGRGQLTDLSPLAGLPLTWLQCGNNPVKDLSPLRGMKFRSLGLWWTSVTDLSPLAGMQVDALILAETAVTDLSPLKTVQMQRLEVQGCKIADFRPLQGLLLREVKGNFRPERDAEILRSMKSLEKINDKPTAEFWKEVDAKKP